MALSFCLTPGCSTLVARGRCQKHAVQQEHTRPNYDVRRWYRTARWFALRAQVKQEQPFCPECEAGGQLELWTDLDHIRPHKGDAVLFWDRANLQGLCSTHHTRKTRRGE